ncbi:hypothetical protein L1987_56152 [Smallanthus sonchifolius]|uniref:Uncharacterized protein n=1 Tax=Smallanthus sonchifolius TaxID=185202 RepID=A0ACB9EBY6_9ASTR|nr:hypothetical protein L1987_56152 [Smallanthus sonchifolius]
MPESYTLSHMIGKNVAMGVCIFVGEGKVIHFVNVNGGGFSALSSTSIGVRGGRMQKTTCPRAASYCGLEKVSGSGVILSCLDCFIKEAKYQASHGFLYAKMVGGTCTMAKSDPPEEVIHRATYLYENGYGKYHVMNNNCEDFAFYCKTGLWSTDRRYQGRSSQANAIHPTNRPKEENGMVDFVLRVVTVVPRSLAKREKKDLGVRDDVLKVPVEELSSFILSLKQATQLQSYK